LPDYLEARQLYFRARYLLAATLLHRSRRAGLPTKRLRLEALRLEGIARFVLDQYPASKTLFTKLVRETQGADQVEALDWLDRIRYAALRRQSVQPVKASLARVEAQ
jgi:hypothetical protein